VARLLIFGSLLYIIEDVVDGLFRVVSCNSALDISEQFGVMFNGL
jgi:hypothetical protein